MKKDKHLRIRLTESQLKKLLDRIITEQQEYKTKSSLVRRILDSYLDDPNQINEKKNQSKR